MLSLHRILILTILVCVVVGLGLAESTLAQGYMATDRKTCAYVHAGLFGVSVAGSDTRTGFGGVFGAHAGNVWDLEVSMAYTGLSDRSSSAFVGGGMTVYFVKQKLGRKGVSLSLSESISTLASGYGSSPTVLSSTFGMHGCYGTGEAGTASVVWSAGPSIVTELEGRNNTVLGVSFEFGVLAHQKKTAIPILVSVAASEESHTFMISVGILSAGQAR